MVEDRKYPLLAEEGPVTSMRRISGLGGAPLSVGLPEQYNFAFDTRSCQVTGVWEGEFLDIGPNVTGNSNSASRILGEWIFNVAKGIAVSPEAAQGSCRYLGSSIGAAAPTISFASAGVETDLTGLYGDNGFTLSYRIRGAQGRALSIQIPEEAVGRVLQSDGSVLERSTSVLATSDDFTLDLVVQ